MGRKQLNEGIDNTFVSSRRCGYERTHPLSFAVIQLATKYVVGTPGAIKEEAMIRVEEPRMKAKRIPFLVTWTSADQVAPKTQIRNAESVRHTADHELNLTGSQLALRPLSFLQEIS